MLSSGSSATKVQELFSTKLLRFSASAAWLPSGYMEGATSWPARVFAPGTAFGRRWTATEFQSRSVEAAPRDPGFFGPRGENLVKMRRNIN